MRPALRLGALSVGWGIALSAAHAGPYAPASDRPGGTGIAAGSTRIAGWASGVVGYQRGPVDASKPNGALASFGTPENTLGPADATADQPYPVMSLGDGGSITLSFEGALYNGPGPDLAVFENGFVLEEEAGLYFLELAFVEVSSDGVHFFRFPSVSLTQTATQVASYGGLDPSNLYNLAGREVAGYGVPFDLAELAGVSPLLDVNRVTQVRLVDVVGSITPGLGSYDARGNLINDPYRTNFNAGGFDLDAVAALYLVPEPALAGLLLSGLGVLALGRRR